MVDIIVTAALKQTIADAEIGSVIMLPTPSQDYIIAQLEAEIELLRAQFAPRQLG